MKKTLKVLTAVISAAAALGAAFKFGEDFGYFESLRDNEKNGGQNPYDDEDDDIEDDGHWYDGICGEPPGFTEDQFRNYSPVCRKCDVDHCIDCGYYYVMKEKYKK